MPPLPPLTALSDDDEPEPKGGAPSVPSAWPPLKALSDDESSHGEDYRELGLRPKRKRKKKHGPTLRDRLDSEVHCRALLTKRCKGCRRPCLMGFASRQNGAFANLLDFRRKWADTHKLDQDRVVSGFKLVVLIHFQRFLVGGGCM